MSGAEVFALIGLISSVITIVVTSRDLYDAAMNVKGLPEAFRAASKNIPLVLNTLRDCKRVQDQAAHDYRTLTDDAYKRSLEQSAAAVEPVIAPCKENVQKPQEIFAKVRSGRPCDVARALPEGFALQAVMPEKRRKVEDLMKEVLEKLQLLLTNQFFRVVR